MTVPIPFGKDKFRLYDVVKEFSPDKHCVVVPVDENDTRLLPSVFDGYTWARKSRDAKSWEITVHDITYSEYFLGCKYFAGKQAFFQEHIDRPDLEYEVIVSFVTHSYENGNYFDDEAILKITQVVYK